MKSKNFTNKERISQTLEEILGKKFEPFNPFRIIYEAIIIINPIAAHFW